MALKWYREAKESFERAAKEAPGDPDVKSFLEVASGMLGEGANTAVKNPIEPYLLSEPIPKRATPFEVSVPLTIEGTVTVNSPAGFRPKPMPKPAPDAENRFVRCQMAVDASASGWRLRYHLHENAGRSAAESYTEYCRAMQQTADLLKPRLVCERVRP